MTLNAYQNFKHGLMVFLFVIKTDNSLFYTLVKIFYYFRYLFFEGWLKGVGSISTALVSITL